MITVCEEEINRKRVVCRMTAAPDFIETRTQIRMVGGWGGDGAGWGDQFVT